jgi:hypothetical protein
MGSALLRGASRKAPAASRGIFPDDITPLFTMLVPGNFLPAYSLSLVDSFAVQFSISESPSPVDRWHPNEDYGNHQFLRM